jgi:hypothetical protein
VPTGTEGTKMNIQTNFNRDIALEELINTLISEKLIEYDDIVKQIKLTIGQERADYIEDLKGISTIIEDLLSELPNKDGEIKIVNGKVQ